VHSARCLRRNRRGDARVAQVREMGRYAAVECVGVEIAGWSASGVGRPTRRSDQTSYALHCEVAGGDVDRFWCGRCPQGDGCHSQGSPPLGVGTARGVAERETSRQRARTHVYLRGCGYGDARLLLPPQSCCGDRRAGRCTGRLSTRARAAIYPALSRAESSDLRLT
jgi:hypothetical protein